MKVVGTPSEETGAGPESAGHITLQIPVRAHPTACYELVRPASRAIEGVLARLRESLTTESAEVQLALPHRRGRVFSMSREDATRFLAALEHAHARRADSVLTLRGRYGHSTGISGIGLG